MARLRAGKKTLARTRKFAKEVKMRRNMMAVLGVSALLAALAGPAVAQEKEYVWKSDGKRYTRTEEFVKPFEMPARYLKEVPAGEQKENDILGFKYTGKTMERVYFRETPFAEAAKGHECTWKMVYEKKAVNKYHFCLENGVEQACPGMNAAGECLGKKK
jgi:hypothetical protein